MYSNKSYFAYVDSIEHTQEGIFVRFDAILIDSLERLHQADTFETRAEQLEPVILEAHDPSKNTQNLRVDHWCRFNIATKSSFGSLAAQLYRSPSDAENIEEVFIENIEHLDGRGRVSRSLRQLVSLDGLQDATQDTIEALLNRQISNQEDNYLAIYNVGQGACSAVLTDSLQPVLYFDLGGGCGRNAGTYPVDFKPCFTLNPPVVLSHWDMDHWISGDRHQSAECLAWIVPRQALGPSHMRFARKLHSHGSLNIWPKNLTSLITPFGQIHKLPNASDRNNSGLVFVAKVGLHNNKIHVLCPGDARYFKLLPQISLPQSLSGLIATHHGGLYRRDIPPLANTKSNYIAYSYGQGNSYGHPHHQTVNKHQNAGWTTRRDSINGNQTIPSLATLPEMPPCGTSRCSLSIVQ
ncbi:MULTISPECIES: hypothetical protein [Acidithiobacillus]|uniref:Metallo-beta-lactamase domain-containing protein n=1 Tax=Acidithiobacillus ferriphilus TaxID=1689834 RepID=A0ABU6FKN4_9PROT|nr:MULTISPECIES: hypothetical protein [Acidithiobacillus]MBU2854705.1 hypothetical protein [Acidithiobacillus ferriphilus]MEB8487458.1 hypothetical protein [Acidithiobacillus ferriphilus]MEB8489202.1 hypothetical protein [Acidithiobacillus ferriphilus]MEB8494177.1 hypothetical protein [Acidithiobacillus ferriphilus]MEB8512611.1 hypothetical protein [Acidithiobacillus ferriphilus]